jgi:hypothetical protein
VSENFTGPFCHGQPLLFEAQRQPEQVVALFRAHLQECQEGKKLRRPLHEAILRTCKQTEIWITEYVEAILQSHGVLTRLNYTCPWQLAPSASAADTVGGPSHPDADKASKPGTTGVGAMSL